MMATSSLYHRLALLCALPLALAACSTSPVIPDEAKTMSRQYMRQADIGGRLSITYAMDNEDKGIHGSFQWTQLHDKTTVNLLSPLGQTVARIVMDAQGATLLRADTPDKTAANADDLVEDVLGWPLPIGGLNQWLQGFGIDQSGQRFNVRPSDNAQTIMTQDGWKLRYVSWQASTGNQYVPRRIDLTRHTRHAGDVDIRIVIDNWQAL